MKLLYKGKSATYQIIIQNLITAALLDTGANIISCFGKVLQVITANTSTIKSTDAKVYQLVGFIEGPLGKCDLTFRLGNKQFTARFIILKDLQRNIILELNWQLLQNRLQLECQWPALYII